MKTIVLLSTKGGSGKTTLAAHLGVAAESLGFKTVLYDTDPQASLGAWWSTREAESPAFAAPSLDKLPDALKAQAAQGFKLALVDTAGSASAMLSKILVVADLILIPVRPSPHDLRALAPTLEIAKASGKPFRFVISGANFRSKLTAQGIAALSAHGEVAPCLVSLRTDFVTSMIDGRTALETAPASQAAQEIRALWTYVLKNVR